MTALSTYSLKGYADMVRCEPRMRAYADAIRAAVTPGCTVIDLGAGPGIFALLACRFGAAKVIAIEPHSSLELLRQFARDQGYADRIEIVPGTSQQYQPTEPADVIISDLRGALPLFQGHVATLCDARERLLKPGGILIPMRDQLRIAVVHSPTTYATVERPWRANDYDLDLTSAARFAVNERSRVELDASALLGPAQDLAMLDYRSITDPNLRATVVIPIEQRGSAHGILIWFDAELAPGIGFSNAPGLPSQVYGQSFFPFETPIGVAPRDQVSVELSARLIGNDYVWSWTTSVTLADGRATPLRYRQSTFLGQIIPADRLAGQSSAAVPASTLMIDIDRACLALVDGYRSRAEIAAEVATQFPIVFADPAAALGHVTRTLARYGDARAAAGAGAGVQE